MSPKLQTLTSRGLLPFLLIISPLLFLTVDFVRVPVLLNECTTSKTPITIRSLFQIQAAVKGTIQGHQIYASLDSIEDSHYLGFVKTHPTALVLGVDHENPSKPLWGGLIRAALRKLDVLSPSDAAALRAVIAGTEPVSGKLVSLALHIPPEAMASFPVDRLYIIGIKSRIGDSGQGKDQQLATLRSGMTALMKEADKDRIENLIVPSVGVDPSDDQTTRYNEYFPAVLKSLQPTGWPARIYLSLYQDLAGSYGEPELNAIQDSWKDVCDEAGRTSVLVRESLRLTLVALFVCLVVSSMHIEITVKNFLIIAAAFSGLVVGAMQSVNFFIQDWDTAHRLFVYVGLLLFLAITFPFLSKWNPGEIFGNKAGK